MSTLITRGYGQARQGIITWGYGRALEEIIEDVIEEVTGRKTKGKGRSRQSRLRRDEQQGVEVYTLEVSLKRINDEVLIDEPIRNKIMERVEDHEGLRMKVSNIEVKSVNKDDDTNIIVTARIKRKTNEGKSK